MEDEKKDCDHKWVGSVYQEVIMPPTISNLQGPQKVMILTQMMCPTCKGIINFNVKPA